jgi:predicted DNA-binding transcriptional regulator YafY
MEELELTENIFEKRKVSLPDFDYENMFPGRFPVKAVFSGKCRWRLVEEYGKDSFQEQKDGTLLFYWIFSDKNHLIRWLLTFGADVKVLEPSEIKEEIKAVVEQIRRNYQEE